MKRVLLYISLAVCLAACGPGGNRQTRSDSGKEEAAAETAVSEAPAVRSFPTVTVPSVYDNNSPEAQDYVLNNYWNAFMGSDGVTDAGHILGVADGDVEQAMANYVEILSMVKQQASPDNLSPLKKAQASISRFFSQIERKQLADTTSLVYIKLTEMVSHYLYDPISPARDEDLYLPFVKAMAESPCTADNMRTACRHEARMCATNPFGSKVPDFRFSDIKGRKSSLYAVNADYIMLFFSNPGCESCKAIIQEVRSRNYIDSYISGGKLAIVNIYIDEEVQKWREYSPNYPSNWINGYDYTFSLRDSGSYDIRAIPSLYLLDSQKRVLMKDAVTEKVLSFLDTI